jgi:hypothetical protein
MKGALLDQVGQLDTHRIVLDFRRVLLGLALVDEIFFVSSCLRDERLGVSL